MRYQMLLSGAYGGCFCGGGGGGGGVLHSCSTLDPQRHKSSCETKKANFFRVFSEAHANRAMLTVCVCVCVCVCVHASEDFVAQTDLSAGPFVTQPRLPASSS